MGILDDAIREHLELKRRLGASDDELEEKESEAFGAGGARAPAPPPEPAAIEDAPDFEVERTAPPQDRPAEEADPWVPPGVEDDLLAPDEVLPQDSLDRNGAHAPPPPVEREPAAESEESEESEEPHQDPFDEWEEEPAPTEDVLKETPEFLEETPEHDRLWFEQKPPKDFDFDD
jgi:hypothetical protein